MILLFLKDHKEEFLNLIQKELDQNPNAREFDGYGRYFSTEECSVEVPVNPKRFVPELLEKDFDNEA